jgi:hypothetical protein
LKNFTSTGINIASTGNESWAISGNTIFEETPRTTGLIGITFASLGTNTITQNTIRDLNTSSSVIGIRLNDVRGTTVSRNRIYSIPSTSGSTSDLTGVQLFGAGTATMNVVNNMISIVPAFTNAQIIRGIDDFGFTGDAFNVYYNSVYIGGSASGSTNTFAFNRRDPAATALRNNIFFNGRTGGTGSHFAASDEENAGTFSSNYNIMVGTGTTTNPDRFMARGTGATTPMTFAQWQATTGTPDLNSQGSVAGVGNYTVGNMFASADDLHLNISGTNPALNAGNPAGTGVTTDFDGQARSSTAPEIGADEVPSIFEFRQTFFGTIANSGNAANSANPDGDALTNAEEFAYGTDPTVATTNSASIDENGVVTPGLPTTQVVNSTFGVNYYAFFTRRADYVAAEITYTPQFSADMATWVSSSANPEVLGTTNGIQAVRVPYPFFITVPNDPTHPSNGQKARFFRMVITVPDI